MITFNEIKYAENLIADNSSKSVNLNELKAMSKYFEYKNKNIKDEIKNVIISKCGKAYNEPIYDTYIDECVKYCKKIKIMGENKLPLTKKEKNALLSLDDYKARRIMFIILMYSKHCILNSKYKKDKEKKDKDKLYFNGSLKEIFKLAKVPYTKKTSLKYMKYLQDNKLVEWGFGDYCLIKMFEYNDNDIDIMLKPLDSIIYYIIEYEGKYKTLECVKCGELFCVSRKNNRTKLCDECNRDNYREKTKDRVKKHRK